jgi:hypothetical protein
MENPTKMELFHAERIMKNSQASPLCITEVLVENLA